MAIFTGIRSELAVTSSCAVIWKQPSPSTAQTMRSGPADLGPDRRRHREAHRAEAARVDPGVGVVEPPLLGGAHLVLADARRDDGVVRGRVAKGLENELRLERT